MAPKLSVATTVAILAILYLVVVDASSYRTTIAATTTNERQKPCKSAESCEEQINSNDFLFCSRIITGFRPENYMGCCQELYKLTTEQCRCDAMKEILEKGQDTAGSDWQTMINKAMATISICHGRFLDCRWFAVSSS